MAGRRGRLIAGSCSRERNKGIMQTKPTTFNKSVPPEERNGFFGIEDELIDNASDARPIVAIVTYVLEDVNVKKIAGEQRPQVKTYSIEPLHDPEAVKTAAALRDAAMAARTGNEALDMSALDDEDDE